MERNNLYTVSEIVSMILKYHDKKINGEKATLPVQRGDIVGWSTASNVPRVTFEKVLDKYFEYVITGEYYKITGIFSKLPL